jgi:hypothetical protein
MQDNAPIYKASSIRNWFLEIGIVVIDWLPYSPDLNPIEHIWWYLKNKVLELYPELLEMGTSDQARELLEKALIEAWDALEDRLFQSCLESMPRRVAAVIEAKGWHTKY